MDEEFVKVWEHLIRHASRAPAMFCRAKLAPLADVFRGERLWYGEVGAIPLQIRRDRPLDCPFERPLRIFGGGSTCGAVMMCYAQFGKALPLGELPRSG